MLPRLRAAASAGKPPLAFLFENPSHTEWTRFDIRLANAYELYTDMVAGGVPFHWDRSERVSFSVGSYVSKSRAALDRAEERARKSKAKNHGRVFYPIPQTIDGGPLPTLEEFMQEMQEERQIERGASKFSNPNSQFNNADWKPEEAPGLD